MLERKVIGMAPGSRLGMLRVIICAAAIISVAFERLASFSELSLVWYQPAGFLKWLPQSAMEALLSSGEALLLFQIVLIVSLFLAMAGIYTTFSLAASAALYFVYAGLLRSYGTFFTQGFVIFYLLFLMVFLSAGDSFSFDEKRKRKKGLKMDMQPNEATGWSVFLLRAVAAFSYWQAACAKLHFTGLSWAEPWNLKRFLIAENLSVSHFDAGLISKAMHFPETFWAVLGGAVLGVELFFPIVLVSWEVRRYFPWAAAAVQIVLFALCPSYFLEASAALVLLLIFYDWDRVFLKHLLPPQDRRSRTKISSQKFSK